MNMIYFCNIDLFADNFLALKKKVYGQLDVFKKRGFTVNLIIINKLKFYIININNNTKKGYIYLNNENLYLGIINLIIKLNPKIIYVRHSPTRFFLMQFYKLIKENCKETKMIIEFPTIPYDEVTKLSEKTLDAIDIDVFYRQQLKNFFDISVNFNGLNSVFGIKSIPIGNGILLEQIPVKDNKINNKNKKEIVLIAVAILHNWHGYERVLNGIHEYYNKYYEKYKYIIKLNIVGIGPSLPKLKKICNNYKLEEYVTFFGLLDGKELDNIFEKSDIALGPLGAYKIGSKSSSPLKTKEYCARGIPFIIGYDDLSFNEDVEYIMKVDDDDSNIDMRQVIKFYETSKKINNLTSIMRKYAEEKLTWEKNFENLFKELKLQ